MTRLYSLVISVIVILSLPTLAFGQKQKSLITPIEIDQYTNKIAVNNAARYRNMSSTADLRVVKMSRFEDSFDSTTGEILIEDVFKEFKDVSPIVFQLKDGHDDGESRRWYGTGKISAKKSSGRDVGEFFLTSKEGKAMDIMK